MPIPLFEPSASEIFDEYYAKGIVNHVDVNFEIGNKVTIEISFNYNLLESSFSVRAHSHKKAAELAIKFLETIEVADK